MEINENKKIDQDKIKKSITPDPTLPDKDADHSGSDRDNDKTDPIKEEESKYDKPKREVDPDSTEIDTEADKTKK